MVRTKPAVSHRSGKLSIGCHWWAIDGVKKEKNPMIYTYLSSAKVEDLRYAKYVDGRGVFQKLSNFQSFFSYEILPIFPPRLAENCPHNA